MLLLLVLLLVIVCLRQGLTRGGSRSPRRSRKWERASKRERHSLLVERREGNATQERKKTEQRVPVLFMPSALSRAIFRQRAHCAGAATHLPRRRRADRTCPQAASEKKEITGGKRREKEGKLRGFNRLFDDKQRILGIMGPQFAARTNKSCKFKSKGSVSVGRWPVEIRVLESSLLSKPVHLFEIA